MGHKENMDKFAQVQDAAVTNAMKWELEIEKHVKYLLSTEVPLQDTLEAFIFVSLVFALTDEPLFTNVWFKKIVITSIGLIATDFFSPAMSNVTRLSLPLIFFSEIPK